MPAFFWNIVLFVVHIIIAVLIYEILVWLIPVAAAVIGLSIPSSIVNLIAILLALLYFVGGGWYYYDRRRGTTVVGP